MSQNSQPFPLFADEDAQNLMNLGHNTSFGGSFGLDNSFGGSLGLETSFGAGGNGGFDDDPFGQITPIPLFPEGGGNNVDFGANTFPLPMSPGMQQRSTPPPTPKKKKQPPQGGKKLPKPKRPRKDPVVEADPIATEPNVNTESLEHVVCKNVYTALLNDASHKQTVAWILDFVVKTDAFYAVRYYNEALKTFDCQFVSKSEPGGNGFNIIPILLPSGAESTELAVPPEVKRFTIYRILFLPFAWTCAIGVGIRTSDTHIACENLDAMEASAIASLYQEEQNYKKTLLYVVHMMVMASRKDGNEDSYLRRLRTFLVMNRAIKFASIGVNFAPNLFLTARHGIDPLPDAGLEMLNTFCKLCEAVVIAPPTEESDVYILLTNDLALSVNTTPDLITGLRMSSSWLVERFLQYTTFDTLRLMNQKINGAVKLADMGKYVYGFDQGLGAENEISRSYKMLKETSEKEYNKVLRSAFGQFQRLTMLASGAFDRHRLEKFYIPGEYSSEITPLATSTRKKYPMHDPFQDAGNIRHVRLQEYLRFLWFHVLPLAKRGENGAIAKYWDSNDVETEVLHRVMNQEGASDFFHRSPQEILVGIQVLTTIVQRGLAFRWSRYVDAATSKSKQKRKRPVPDYETQAITNRIPHFDLFTRVLDDYLYVNNGGMKAYPGFYALSFKMEDDFEKLDTATMKNSGLGDRSKPPITFIVPRRQEADLVHYGEDTMPYPASNVETNARQWRTGKETTKGSTVGGSTTAYYLFSGLGKPDIASPNVVYMDIPSNTVDVYTAFSHHLDIPQKAKNRIVDLPLVEMGSQNRWTELGFVIYKHYFERHESKMGFEFFKMGMDCTVEFVLLVRQILYEGHFRPNLLLDLLYKYVHEKDGKIEIQERFANLFVELLGFVIFFGNQRYANTFNLCVIPEMFQFLVRWSQHRDMDDPHSLFRIVKSKLGHFGAPSLENVDAEKELAAHQTNAVSSNPTSPLLIPSIPVNIDYLDAFTNSIVRIVGPLFLTIEPGTNYMTSPNGVWQLGEHMVSTSTTMSWHKLREATTADLQYGLLQSEAQSLIALEEAFGVLHNDERHLNAHPPVNAHPPADLDDRFAVSNWQAFPNYNPAELKQRFRTLEALAAGNDDDGGGGLLDDFNREAGQHNLGTMQTADLNMVIRQYGLYDLPPTRRFSNDDERLQYVARHVRALLDNPTITTENIAAAIQIVRQQVQDSERNSDKRPRFVFYFA